MSTDQPSPGSRSGGGPVATCKRSSLPPASTSRLPGQGLLDRMPFAAHVSSRVTRRRPSGMLTLGLLVHTRGALFSLWSQQDGQHPVWSPISRNLGAPHQRASHQRAHPGPGSALGRPQRRAGRHRPRRGRAASGRRRRTSTSSRWPPWPSRPVAKLMDFGKFKYEAAHEGPGSPQEPGQHRHQGDQAPPEDRPARLRHQEGPRRAVPQGRRQGQGDDHVPRPRAVAAPSWAFRLLQRLAEDIAELGFVE